MKKKIVILTGAGISAESGIKTFRDADGLWEGHDVMTVATPEGWRKDKELVLKFYNDRRAQLLEVKPNAAHLAISSLSEGFEVHVITQNVDDLHERAGNTNIIHLHGELCKARSEGNVNHIVDWTGNMTNEDQCPEGFQMRPHIVWFGEAVPALEEAIEVLRDAHYVWIIGTSMQVYPAASLVAFAPKDANIYYIDPRPQINHELSVLDVKIIEDKAVNSVPALVREFLENKAGENT